MPLRFSWIFPSIRCPEKLFTSFEVKYRYWAYPLNASTYLKYFLVLQVFKNFFKYFKIINTKHCYWCLQVTHNFIIYLICFLFYFCIFILGMVFNIKGFLIKNKYCFWGDKNRFFYTFRKIHITEMLPESFIYKFLKLLIKV